MLNNLAPVKGNDVTKPFRTYGI